MDFFDSMLAYNVVTFNTLIAALVQYNKSEETSKIFRQMQLKAVSPNEVTFINVVSAVVALARLGNDVEICTLGICSDFASYVTLNNVLLNMYGKAALPKVKRLTDSRRRPIAGFSQLGATLEAGLDCPT
ncbi:hypothetical protein L7F22_062933 [Adiantum nelumboides]|nr:hypothetical protein [Adiantum nelumboides]